MGYRFDNLRLEKGMYNEAGRSFTQVLEREGLEPLELECKEGLSMLNGTISVTAFGLLASYDSILAAKNAEIAGVLCYEALRGTPKALDERIHAAKAHPEQQQAAQLMRDMLAGSELCEKHAGDKVQDSCLLRAMPQVHASIRRLVGEAQTAIVEEMHSISDNPEIFGTEDGDGVALMCGNFDGTFVGPHADIIGMACAIAGKETGRSISRMVDRNLNDGLPAFLVSNPGLNSGFMIPQYTAAGLMNEIKHLAIPATIDSIPTCAGQEDPVSMAYYASKKAQACVRKLQYVTAIEIYTALQATDFLKPETPSPAIAKVRDFLRQTIPFVDNDRFLYPDIEYIFDRVRDCTLTDLVEEEIGELAF